MIKTAKLPRLGDFLRAAREKSGLTQREIAAQLGYSTPQFISEWERGTRSPPGSVLAKLVKIYGMSLRRFYDVILAEQIRSFEADLKRDLPGAR